MLRTRASSTARLPGFKKITLSNQRRVCIVHSSGHDSVKSAFLAFSAMVVLVTESASASPAVTATDQESSTTQSPTTLVTSYNQNKGLPPFLQISSPDVSTSDSKSAGILRRVPGATAAAISAGAGAVMVLGSLFFRQRSNIDSDETDDDVEGEDVPLETGREASTRPPVRFGVSRSSLAAAPSGINRQSVDTPAALRSRRNRQISEEELEEVDDKPPPSLLKDALKAPGGDELSNVQFAAVVGFIVVTAAVFYAQLVPLATTAVKKNKAASQQMSRESPGSSYLMSSAPSLTEDLGMPKKKSLLTSIAAKAAGAGVVVALGGVAVWSLVNKPKKPVATLSLRSDPEFGMPVIIRRPVGAAASPGVRRSVAVSDDEDDEDDGTPPPPKPLPFYKRLVAAKKPTGRRPSAASEDEDDDDADAAPPSKGQPAYKRLAAVKKTGVRPSSAASVDEEEEADEAPSARVTPRFMKSAAVFKPGNNRSAAPDPTPAAPLPERAGLRRIPVTLPPVPSGVLYPSASKASAEAANLRVISKRSSSPQVSSLSEESVESQASIKNSKARDNNGQISTALAAIGLSLLVGSGVLYMQDETLLLPADSSMGGLLQKVFGVVDENDIEVQQPEFAAPTKQEEDINETPSLPLAMSTSEEVSTSPVTPEAEIEKEPNLFTPLPIVPSEVEAPLALDKREEQDFMAPLQIETTQEQVPLVLEEKEKPFFMNPFATEEAEKQAPFVLEEKKDSFFKNSFASEKAEEQAPFVLEEKEKPFFMNPFATEEAEEQAPFVLEEKKDSFFKNPFASEKAEKEAPSVFEEKEEPLFKNPFATSEIAEDQAPLELREEEEPLFKNPFATVKAEEDASLDTAVQESFKSETAKVMAQEQTPMAFEEAEEEEEETYFITSLPVAIEELEREVEMVTRLATSTLNGVNVSAAIGICMVTLSASAVASVRSQVQLEDDLAYALPAVSPSSIPVAGSPLGGSALPAATADVPSAVSTARPAASGVTVMSFSDAVAIMRKQELRDSSISPLSMSSSSTNTSSDELLLPDGPEDAPPYIPSVRSP
ncbi:hypothetical protein CEUSTIGMA_g10054.t1 [Chlamydomonas eustigma]|uniref:Transmembrane protein n=1 Tax=Chlamydomonas eustigma TaxID=1157962 RepID=A0A250XHS7_9CHLO|nr:hypothetical protein CEUSTIGMA_g10054.t1 [Chlamydomonas eustigma]|eukprot:GAX82628.1 hypothetical protein CEUSTIGMA_g10054.t1 [Chlamydomonas eustigma]